MALALGVGWGAAGVVGQPFPGFRLTPWGTVSLADRTAWPGSQGLRIDMALRSHAGQPCQGARELAKALAKAQPGQRELWTFELRGERHSFLMPVARYQWSDFAASTLPLVLLGLLYSGFGLLAHAVRPKDPAGRAHLIWASWVGLLFVAMADHDTTAWLPELYVISPWLALAACFHLAVDFPRPAEGVLRAPAWRLLPYLLTAVPALAMAWTSWVGRMPGGELAAAAFVSQAMRWELGMVGLGILALGAAIATRTLLAQERSERRMGQVLLSGLLIGFGPHLALMVTPYALGRSNPFSAYAMPTALIYAAFPAAIAWSMLRHNLFMVRLSLPRPAIMALAWTGSLALTFLAALSLIGALEALDWLPRGQVALAFALAAAAALLGPVAAGLAGGIDQLLDRAQARGPEARRRFLTAAGQTLEVPELVAAFERAVGPALAPTQLTVWLLDEQGRHRPALAPEGLILEEAPQPPPGGLSLPLEAGASPVGLVVLGPRRAGLAYGSSDQELLASLGHPLALALRASALAREAKARASLQRELEIAAEVQMGLLPTKLTAPNEAQLAIACVPATEVGGDFFDVRALGEHRWGLVVGDVVGKGVPASLMMAVALTSFRAVAPAHESPAEALAVLNDLIHAQRPNAKLFVSAIYAIYDAKEGTVCVANAGMPPPMVDGLVLPAKGLPLGARQGTRYREVLQQLGEGSTLWLASDGLEDATDPQGKSFGHERLEALARGLAGTPADAAGQALSAALEAHMAGSAPADDMTWLLLRRATGPGGTRGVRLSTGPLHVRTQPL